jgi:hypothetical protein
MIQDAAAKKDMALLLSDGHFVKGQHFFGSWAFDAERVRALLRGEEPGLVRTSIVEFRYNGMQSRECPERDCLQFLGNLEFGVQLMLCHVSEGRFVLLWHPQVTTFSVLQENLDLIDIHLHGHIAEPAIMPLSYEGNISTANQHVDVSKGYYTPAYYLSKSDVVKFLEHDCLIGALTIRLYYMGEQAGVIAAAAISNPKAQNRSWRTESAHKVSEQYGLAQCFPEVSNATDSEDSPPHVSEKVHEATTTNHVL